MKVYLSGPISNTLDYKIRFKDFENYLKSKGVEVVNPVTVGIELEKRLQRTPTISEYLLEDLKQLSQCQICYFIPGYLTSNGCKVEDSFCDAVGITKEYLKYNLLKTQ